jgi:uncharacterized circularly permuted ATP-grasp superfamily protein/uncharacterized alpha-E superfamily protein
VSTLQSLLPLTPGALPPAGEVLSRRVLPAEAGVWDELRGAPGADGGRPAGPAALRRVWQRFADLMPAPEGDPAVDLDARRARIGEGIRRDGITHNVFGPDGAAARPWSLELLPLLLEPAEWAVIEQGLRQRAELLEATLADLYGPQRLLHEGLLPPALLLRHPGYVRAMRGVRPAGGQHLRIVAFDIARGADGGWQVVAQRTQGPSGLGYVLHNRLLVSAQFPQAFRELRVQHLASSYRHLLDGLEEAARAVAGGSAPRIALLTPGPYSETWFEQAYLARYLGLPLVEGSDLTVRQERLYLRTVEGLEPVHGLLRRVDDDWCDPLELRPDSALGVPGLVQAARAGTVVMANALGSAFLESPALQGFLPGVCQRLLGQALVLPSLPTWWCGERAAWDDVRGRLQGKLLRSTFPHGGRTSQVHDPAQVDVDDDPDAWTVQGRLRFGRAPIWGGGGVMPRPAMVRVYAIAGPGGRWRVLPGGMTRVAQREDHSVSMHRGGTSLDTWVLTDGEVDTFSMLPQPLRVEDIAGRRTPVGSRTGENLFWLGRYTERSEQAVRLAQRLLPLCRAAVEAPASLQRALSALAVRQGLVLFGVPTLAQSALLFERALLAALGDADGAFSVAFDLRALQRSAQALRERLSPQQWDLARALGEGFVQVLGPAGAGTLPRVETALAALDQAALQLAAVTGAQTDRMTRDAGWRLLTVGRLLERLLGLTATLEELLAADALRHDHGVDMLLELFDSAITFRARHQRHGDLLALVDVLVLDDTNPRSLAGVLRRLRTEISRLPAVGGEDGGPRALLAALPPQGAGLSLQDLAAAGDAGLAQALLAQCRNLHQAALGLADRVGQRHFTLAEGLAQVRV